MKDFIAEYSVLLSYPRDLVLLCARWTLAYGFTFPALMKVSDMEATQKWFESYGIPFAHISTFLVSSIEVAGIVLLTLGLFTRYISLLLSSVMLGAIFFVHWEHGFSVSNNGIEIPLYYLIFLMIFLFFGPGKYSLDHMIFREKYNA
jgi:putative oxidoreductase